MNKDNDQKEENMIDVISSGEIDSIYFNEFGIGVSKNDILILLSRNGKAEVVLNASHITAKTLVTSLAKAIENFEDKTNQKIPIADEIESLMEDQDELNE